ncbi:histidine kinase [Blautia schinkii]|nr:histidine kinase [Blautia schinkii]
MKHWFYKLSLQKKMLYSYGLLFVVSLAALLVFFFRSFVQVRTTELAHMTEYNGQLSLNLDTLVSSTDPFRYLHFSDDRIRNLLSSDDKDIDAAVQEKSAEKLEQQLTLLADMQDHVLRALVVTADGRIYGSIGGDYTGYLSEMDKRLEGIDWDVQSSYFSEVHGEIIDLVKYQVISMVSPVWNVFGDEPLAMVYLDLDFNKIANQWHRSAAVGQSSDFMILSASQILFDSGVQSSDTKLEKNLFSEKISEFLNSGGQEGTLSFHEKRCVVSATKNESTGWVIVQYLPNELLMERIVSNMWLFFMILAAVIVVTAVGSAVLSRQVSRPVQVLSQVMGKVARDSKEEQEIPLFEDKDIVWEDEVGQMIHSYNSMARRINDNIIKMYVYRLNQKQTELKMLQFQINPHFLYNALNTISAIARLEDVEYIPEIASSLSDMFRYNISGSDIVTIREELEQTEHYMSIQKIRFPQRFETYYEVEEGLGECRVLKFVLQPIVENAYKYGFSRKRARDVLCIRVFREGDEDVRITVEDDGIGMEPEKVQSLNKAFSRAEFSGTSGGIGLQNVNARLKTYYGDSYGIYVESEKDSYTRVCLRIQYMDKRQEEHRGEHREEHGEECREGRIESRGMENDTSCGC